MVACFEVVLWVLILYLFIFQMIIPTVKGTKIFPIFRKKEKELFSKLTDVNQSILEKDIEKKIIEQKILEKKLESEILTKKKEGNLNE